MTFYCIDLDVNQREDFEACATKVEARSKSDAAYTMAIFETMDDGMAIFETMDDGSKARIMVADNPAGDGAVVFTVTQRVTVTYDIDEEA